LQALKLEILNETIHYVTLGT